MTTEQLDDMPEADYHEHPALSCSGAKLLLPPSCPAIFQWTRSNPRPPTDAMKKGTAAHTEALGIGQGFDRLPFDDRRTKAYAAAKAESEANGRIPLLAREYDDVIGMADALRLDPVAGPYFERSGKAEVSLFFDDARFGVERRARIDFLPDQDEGPWIVADYKKARSANPTAFAKAVADYGYHQQAAWYRDAVTALYGRTPAFVFIVQEDVAPYVVSVVQLDADWLDVGYRKNDRALEVYQSCRESNDWPGYTSGEVALIERPAWSDREYA